MKNCIYKLTAPSGKVYIGQTVCFSRRMNKYSNLNCKGQPKLYRAIFKYGWENFTKEIIDIYNGDQVKEGLNALETYWITHYDSVKSGYNCLSDGGSVLGYRHSEVTKEKIRQCASLRVHSDESKKKMSDRSKGREISENTRLKLKIASTGKRHSVETKIKLRNIRIGRKHSNETRKKMSQSKIKNDFMMKK